MRLVVKELVKINKEGPFIPVVFGAPETVVHGRGLIKRRFHTHQRLARVLIIVRRPHSARDHTCPLKGRQQIAQCVKAIVHVEMLDAHKEMVGEPLTHRRPTDVAV